MHQKGVTHSDGSYEKKSRRRAWLKKWDKVKIPWYTHRLMHRKRVTCGLHDSYFRLMTIKHANPKTEWAIELLYNSVKTGSQWVGEQTSWREDVVGKATTQQKGPSGPPWSWRSDELETRCGRESHHPPEGALGTPDWVWRSDQLERRCWNENMSQRRWAPRPPVELSRRTRTTHSDARRGWEGQYIAVLFGLQLPLTHKLFARLIIASICILHVYVYSCIYIYYVAIQQLYVHI